MAESPKKTNFELNVELTKALAWPLLAGIVLASFWSPLQRTADLVPALVGRSDTITIAGLSLKIGQNLHSQASPEVRAILAHLSKAGVERVLEMGASSYWNKDAVSRGQEVNAELIKLGLVVEIPQTELDARNLREGRDYGYAVKRSALGEQTQAFLRSIVAEFVQELPKDTKP